MRSGRVKFVGVIVMEGSVVECFLYMNCQPTGLESRWSRNARESNDARLFMVSSSSPSDWSNSATAPIERVDVSVATCQQCPVGGEGWYE